MRNGFTFKNKSSSEFPYIVIKTRDRPIMPAPKMSEFEADNMSGSYDFTDYTGLTFYKNRTVQIDITVLGEGLNTLQNRMNAVMVWLSGKGEIIFDDTPAVVWTGRVSESVSYMPERGGKHATLAVSFQCEPFTKFIHDAFDGVQLDDKIPIDAMIHLDENEYHTLSAGSHTFKIYGDAPAMPIFKKTGTGVWELTVSCANEEYNITCDETASTIIDCAKKQVYKTSDGTNLMAVATGDFPLLMPDVEYTIETTREMEIHYRAKYFYNGGMS